MNRGKISWLFALAWIASAVVGCAAGPDDAADSPSRAAHEDTPPPSMFAFTADEYDDVFDAAVRELRDAGFRIARNDRRFGVITTWPKESPTAFEPWVGDNTTGELARRSTLNHLRRSVEVTIWPADGAVAEVGADYALTLAVAIERRQQPNRYMTHSARGSIASSYDTVPAHLAQQGIPASYWEPAGDDPRLAQRLLGVIQERAGAAFEPQYDDEDLEETVEP